MFLLLMISCVNSMEGKDKDKSSDPSGQKKLMEVTTKTVFYQTDTGSQVNTDGSVRGDMKADSSSSSSSKNKGATDFSQTSKVSKKKKPFIAEKGNGKASSATSNVYKKAGSSSSSSPKSKVATTSSQISTMITEKRDLTTITKAIKDADFRNILRRVGGLDLIELCILKLVEASEDDRAYYKSIVDKLVEKNNEFLKSIILSKKAPLENTLQAAIELKNYQLLQVYLNKCREIEGFDKVGKNLIAFAKIKDVRDEIKEKNYNIRAQSKEGLYSELVSKEGIGVALKVFLKAINNSIDLRSAAIK